jgi:hypothetical protein
MFTVSRFLKIGRKWRICLEVCVRQNFTLTFQKPAHPNADARRITPLEIQPGNLLCFKDM